MIPAVKDRRIKAAVCAVPLWAALVGPGHAHASEQGFVLLLPTGAYILAGTAAVALTVLAVTVLPGRVVAGLFRPVALIRLGRPRLPLLTSCLSFAALVWLVWLGNFGPRDPLANLLPLVVWTLWWAGFVVVQGLFGDLWRYLNPWTGPVAVARRALRLRPFLRYPKGLGHGGAIVTYLGFMAVLVADPAPSDPARLASYVAGYWLFAFAGMLAFGPRWLHRAEGITVLMRAYASLGIFARRGGWLRIGVPGWQVPGRVAPAAGIAALILMMLGSGSFDGLNGTFWWLGHLRINPLEFPGRSAVIWQSVTGLLAANALLIAAYGLAVWLGLRLIDGQMRLSEGFRLFAPSILPIALAYHFAHFLTGFLVDGQYALIALNDPLASGADLLGLGKRYVSTGFFNTRDTVRTIWLSQAGAVVLGHVMAVTLAHALALRALGSNRKAALCQAPLALFMVLYTLFGLWLLASPRGV